MIRPTAWRLRSAIRFGMAQIAATGIAAIAARPDLLPIGRTPTRWLEKLVLTGADRALFDDEHYLGINDDVLAAGVVPFDHYLADGWRESRAPNACFDDGHYRRQAGLGQAPVSALGHFAAVGRRRGLSPMPESQHSIDPAPLEIARVEPYTALAGGRTGAEPAPRPVLEHVLSQLPALSPAAGGAEVVDVIIPVHSGRAETLNTIVHVLEARQRTRFELVVVADTPPDASLVADLQLLAERGLLTLLENERNLGFPGTVNRGMALHPDRDVVWLNADTEVYGDWLDRLRATALAASDVATVTPLTNNGTICSYPLTDRDNPADLLHPWAEIDAMTADVNAGESIEAPTCVGFATYVRRAAIDAIGALDAETFGLGYGEENDFSQRAAAAGWRNLVAADVFVRHFGATSFKGLKAERVERAVAVVTERHPGYLADVARFVADDPLAPARARLDRARLRPTETRAVLIVTHSRGGGTAQHVQEETARLRADGCDVYLLTGSRVGRGTARIARSGDGPMPSLDGLDWQGEELWSIIGALGVERVDLHHLIDLPIEAPQVFATLLEKLRIPYRFIVHDYFAACPRINLADHRGHYCGEPGLAGCRRCLLAHGSSFGRVDIRRWRARYGALLAGATTIIVPNEDVATRLHRYWPDLASEIRPHDQEIPRPLVRRSARGGPLRVAVIGAIGPIKGIDSVLRLAEWADPADLEIAVIGYTHDDDSARLAGIRVTGAYLNAHVQEEIDKVDPDLIWISSIWPETFCYTLSIAFASGRPIAAFDLGAQAARIAETGRGALIPLALAFEPEHLLDHLLRAAERTQEEEDFVPTSVERFADTIGASPPTSRNRQRGRESPQCANGTGDGNAERSDAVNLSGDSQPDGTASELA